MLLRKIETTGSAISLELSILDLVNTLRLRSVWDLQSQVEFSTFFDRQRVAKASTGLIPQPFLITIFNKYLNFS